MTDMQIISASDLPKGNKSFLLYGRPGSGKTSALLTLPGRTLVHVFDPPAAASLRGAANVDVRLFIGDDVNVNPTSMSSGSKARTTPVVPVREPKLYEEYLKFFAEAYEKGVYEQYDNICWDSLTTIQSAIMRRQTWINQRSGNVAMQDDYLPAMGTLHGGMEEAMGKLAHKLLVFTAHETAGEDKVFGYSQITLHTIGKLRDHLPGLFTDVFHTVVEEGRFFAEILKTPKLPAAKCSFRNITKARTPRVELTITDWAAPTSFGIGKMLSEEI